MSHGVAAVVLATPLVWCAVAEAAEAHAPAVIGAPSVAAPRPTDPSAEETVPSESEVSEAQDAAELAAEEVAAITAELEAAEARLEALQREVAEAVSAHEKAQEQLADAEEAVERATARLETARRAREAADAALSSEAALIYMQGGALQNLTALLLTPPNAMSDLTVVLDGNARRVDHELRVATKAAAEAANRERELSAARDDREAAADEAGETRVSVEKDAEKAGEEAARLGELQEALSARLDELEAGAADLATRREAAARPGGVDLLGLQGDGSLGSGPRAAQEIARSMMPTFGWDDDAEFACLVTLWHNESGWSWSATNPSSGAYGIPQALPGWKMASAGSDWLTNPATQIAWGMDYIDGRYGSPCSALDAFYSRSPHWY